ncbi:MAG: diguanylate cyclase [Bacillota bacterium]
MKRGETPDSVSAEADANSAAKAGFIANALCDADGKLISLDPALLRTLAYPPEDIQTLNLFDLLADPHDKTAITEELKAGDDLTGYQTSLHHANGTMVPVRISIHQIDCDATRRLMVLLMGYDGLCEKQQQTEARYHLIFNSVPVGITITDRSGYFYAFNPAFNEMLLYSPMQLRGMEAAAVYQTAADRKRFVETLYRDKTVRNFETNLIRKDGRVINVLLNSDLFDYGNLENAMLSSVRDITPLKTIEAKLIKERNFSETVLDTSDSLIMVFDKDGKVIKFNKACERTTGYAFAEISGRPFWELVSQDPEFSRARVRQIVENRHIESFESYWKTTDGRLRLIKWANVMLVDEDGYDYIVSTGSDITEKRKAHEAVREANRELEKSLKRLEEKTQAISLLADMEGFLQRCRTVEKACAILAQFVHSICPQTGGAVYLINETKDMAEAQETWGDETVSEKQFPPANCWSVRHGRMSLIDENNRELPCRHISADISGQYLCIPMEANGKMLGIVHVSFIADTAASETPAESAPYFESRLRLLTAASETAALSMANIMLQNTLRQQSIRDPLTGIYNRRYMVESLTRELSRAQREQASVSVLMFDIDHFKKFNDTYGHDGGDTLLRHLGEFLRQNTRGEDIVCRYGGEEFVVVLPNTRLQSAMQKADAMRIGVSRLGMPHLGSQMRSCTISIGVASYPLNGLTAEELLKAADIALYTAKREGRNRVVSS